MSKQIHIIGCGGHARSILDILIHAEPQMDVVFLDANAKNDEYLYGFPILKDKLLEKSETLFIALGDNMARAACASKYSAHTFHTIISKSAHVGFETIIKEGVFIGNFVHIGPQVLINQHTIITNGAIVEHEVKIGAYCHIGPNVAISGKAKIGDHVFLGVGSTVINNITICSNVIIGAGATVITDITLPGTYVGTPAKKLNK